MKQEKKYFLLPASCFLLLIYSLLFLTKADAIERAPRELQGVGITEHRGSLIPLDLEFKNETGKTIPLNRFFDEKIPVIVALVYYECPSLCNWLLNGLTEALKQMTWIPGRQFQIVTVSIDPGETPQIASQKKGAYLKEYGRNEEGIAGGWSFLTGTKENIRKLADSLGFGFQYDHQAKQYTHAAGLFVLTPEGKIDRILYGTHFSPWDIKLALTQSGEGKIGNWVDKLLVFLFKYDSAERKYKFDIF